MKTFLCRFEGEFQRSSETTKSGFVCSRYIDSLTREAAVASGLEVVRSELTLEHGGLVDIGPIRAYEIEEVNRKSLPEPKGFTFFPLKSSSLFKQLRDVFREF